MIDFAALAISREDQVLINAIAKRGVALAHDVGILMPGLPVVDMTMNLEACHAIGCPLKLSELLAADDGNFGHDVFGIRGHLDRETGKLTDCFRPRFAV